MDMKMDVHDYYDVVMEITSGIIEQKEAMRHCTHDEIATRFVKQCLKKAKEAPA